MPRRRRDRPALTGVLFVRHATSAGMRQARFPADLAADPSSLARAEALARALPAGEAWTSPARAARETCAALGLDARPVAALAEADHGSWAGVRFGEADPDALAAWLADPDAAPPAARAGPRSRRGSRRGSTEVPAASPSATRA